MCVGVHTHTHSVLRCVYSYGLPIFFSRQLNPSLRVKAGFNPCTLEMHLLMKHFEFISTTWFLSSVWSHESRFLTRRPKYPCEGGDDLALKHVNRDWSDLEHTMLFTNCSTHTSSVIWLGRKSGRQIKLSRIFLFPWVWHLPQYLFFFSCSDTYLGSHF